jgi:DNA-binding response OmpR family regulator
MGKKIYIIEDEPEMLEILKILLVRQQYTVQTYSEGRKILHDLESNQILPDLILLDLMLPDISGLEICSILKNKPKTKNIPIIALTAKSDDFDIMTGLNLGCDDYIVKPFSNQVLVARINSVLRRVDNQKEESSLMIFKDLVLDTEKYEASIKGRVINLTALEFKTLVFFMKNKGRVFTRAQILELSRDESFFDVEERVVDCIISRLRKKLREYGYLIESVYGVGYCFKDKESEKVCA